jgi:hypothetical protein
MHAITLIETNMPDVPGFIFVKRLALFPVRRKLFGIRPAHELSNPARSGSTTLQHVVMYTAWFSPLKGLSQIFDYVQEIKIRKPIVVLKNQPYCYASVLRLSKNILILLIAERSSAALWVEVCRITTTSNCNIGYKSLLYTSQLFSMVNFKNSSTFLKSSGMQSIIHIIIRLQVLRHIGSCLEYCTPKNIIENIAVDSLFRKHKCVLYNLSRSEKEN